MKSVLLGFFLGAIALMGFLTEWEIFSEFPIMWRSFWKRGR